MLTSSAASVAREKGRAHLKNNVFLSVISDEQNTRDQLVHSTLSVLSCLGKERYSKQNAACTDSSTEEVMFDCIVCV